ncbi:Ribosomal protein L13a [Plasmodiophora brassicae]|uniref:Ribosomal protein L13a n=1 Tax=Plasmodiophora brassicae TaxID=37360 RepID=A0A0G4J7T5_PLABS|nr:hypothetical protein PBRA_003260 [Plasmodiophora brassicae]SPQ99622.1 unnamed protein product [Plasmodiophora brassicae]
MFEKTVVVDGRGHLLGRLASVLAKELLNGQRVVVVRTELIEMSGSLFRNKTKYWAFLRKRHNTNPKRGPFHERAPSKILARVIRGMVPYKTKRGQEALARLQTFEGVPPAYQKVKRQVVPDALRMLRLQPGRKWSVLGDLSNDVGWKYRGIIAKLEDKRKARNEAWLEKRRRLEDIKKTAVRNVEQANPQLAASLHSAGF